MGNLIHSGASAIQPRIGDVYMVQFDGTGSVQRGFRPAVVFSNDIGNKYSPNVVALPLSSCQIAHDDFVFEGKRPTAGQTKQKILRRLILGYEKDYEAWKRAFEQDLKKDFGLDKLPHQFEW